MKFTVLSHAGLAVEHRGVQLICDPWLVGSCYWRSWWNFPEPDPLLIRALKPQFIYLTHLHWDHFHGPSLQKLFDPSTRILVPKVPTRRMVDDLRWLGFSNVTELPHGKRFRLGEDFQLQSYQFGVAVDSAAVISGGGVTLFNCNDCKFFGLPLRQIMRDHPQIDFMFRSHSSASPVPHCVEEHERLLPASTAGHDSAEQFARCALHVRPRYAVPFASNHCFLHRETRGFNSTATTPDLAEKYFRRLAAETGARGECVVMPPNSRWADDEGFAIRSFDFAQRDEYVAQMLKNNAQKLETQYALEEQALMDVDAFSAYFHAMLAAIPAFLRRRLGRLTFKVCDGSGVRHFEVDAPARRIAALEHAPPDQVSIEVPAIVLNDCVTLKMFSSWTPSKRLKIRLPSAAALSIVNLWFTLFDLYEVDMLPVRRNFSARSLAVRLRRWREPVELARLLLRRFFLRRRFTLGEIYPIESN